MVGHTEFLRIRIGVPLGISLITQPVLLGLKQRRAPVPCVHEKATRVLGKQRRPGQVAVRFPFPNPTSRSRLPVSQLSRARSGTRIEEADETKGVFSL